MASIVSTQKQSDHPIYQQMKFISNQKAPVGVRLAKKETMQTVDFHESPTKQNSFEKQQQLYDSFANRGMQTDDFLDDLESFDLKNLNASWGTKAIIGPDTQIHYMSQPNRDK